MTEPAPELPEEAESLWLLAASPGLWAAHFALSYATVAVWCAKHSGPDGSLGPARAAIGVYTAAALVGILLVGRRGWRGHRRAAGHAHDADSPAGRHGFLGFTVSILSGMSAIGVVFVALPAVLIGSAR